MRSVGYGMAWSSRIRRRRESVTCFIGFCRLLSPPGKLFYFLWGFGGQELPVLEVAKKDKSTVDTAPTFVSLACSIFRMSGTKID